jgi:hypothetical protein
VSASRLSTFAAEGTGWGGRVNLVAVLWNVNQVRLLLLGGADASTWFRVVRSLDPADRVAGSRPANCSQLRFSTFQDYEDALRAAAPEREFQSP